MQHPPPPPHQASPVSPHPSSHGGTYTPASVSATPLINLTNSLNPPHPTNIYYDVHFLNWAFLTSVTAPATLLYTGIPSTLRTFLEVVTFVMSCVKTVDPAWQLVEAYLCVAYQDVTHIYWATRPDKLSPLRTPPPPVTRSPHVIWDSSRKPVHHIVAFTF